MTSTNNDVEKAEWCAEFVSQHSGLTIEELLAYNRTPYIAYMRFLMYWMMRQTTCFSLANIARICNRNCHRSVDYGINRINDILQADSNGNIEREIKRIIKIFNETKNSDK